MWLALDKRLWNTIWLPVRTAWTIVYWWMDILNTAVTLPKQALEIVSNTTGQIKDVFSNAWNKWRRYNKIVNVPLSPFMATWTAIEWAIRAVVNPTWNAFTHTRDVAGNILINTWNSIKWTASDKPVSDFKYEHLKTNPVWTKNYISKRQWFSGESKKWEAKKIDIKKDEAKLEVNKEEEPKAKKDEWERVEIKKENSELEWKIIKMEAQMAQISEQLAKLLLDKEWPKWKSIKMNPRPRREVDADMDMAA